MDDSWPLCSLCGYRYDPEFIASNPCRAFDLNQQAPDEVLPGCPVARKIREQLGGR